MTSTFNPLDKNVLGQPALSNGDLSISYASSYYWSTVRATESVASSGVTYFEFAVTAKPTDGYIRLGFVGPTFNPLDPVQFIGDYYSGYLSATDFYFTNNHGFGSLGEVILDGQVYLNFSDAWGAGDIIGVAVDNTEQKIWFTKNGVLQGRLLSSGDLSGWYPAVSIVGPATYPSATTVTGIANFGAVSFIYDPLDVLVTPTVAITITLNDQTKTYGTLATTLDETQFIASGLVSGDTITRISLYSPGQAAASVVGSYPITAYGIAEWNSYYASPPSGTVYDVTFVNGTLTVATAALSIAATSAFKLEGTTKVFTTTDFVATGLQNSDAISSVSLASTGAPSSAADGSYAIVPSAAVFSTGSASNYTITYVNGTLVVRDVPTAVTFDSATKNSFVTLSVGDLKASITTANGGGAVSTTAKTTGKWYAEFTFNEWNSINSNLIGIVDPAFVAAQVTGNGGAMGGTNSYAYYSNNGNRYSQGTSGAYGASYTTGDIIGVAFDGDAHTITFYKNGASQGVLSSVTTTSYHVGVSNIYANGGTTSFTANFGASTFVYAPPSGYSAWDGSLSGSNHGYVSTQVLTAAGSRLAAGAGSFQALTSTGYNAGTHNGAGSLSAFTAVGSGGTRGGAVSIEALTATGEGHPAVSGEVTLEALTAISVGGVQALVTVEVSAPAPTLSSSGVNGEVITMVLTAPTPTLEFGTKDIVLTAPAPTLVSTLLRGSVITVTAEAPVPILVATCINPPIITFSGTIPTLLLSSTGLAGTATTFARSAPAPRLSASVASGVITTFARSAPVARLSATGFAGNVATILAEAATPIMVAAGYPAYTITFAGTAPASRLVATLTPAITEAYRTWVLNLRKGALAEYDNFAFNSYAVFNGQVIAVGPAGLFVLGTQDLDNATAITARVRTGKNSFGSSLLKRVPRIYVGHTTDGDLTFRTITNEGGTRSYLLGWNHATGLQQRRVPIGKGPKSKTWAFEIENVNGADFDLDSLLVYPVALRRRVQ